MGRNAQVAERVKMAQAFVPAAKTSTVTGTAIDTQGFDSAMLYLQVAAVSGTTPTLDVKVQESANNSDWSDVSGLTLAQITDATHEKTLQVDLRPLARYVRMVGTIGGTSPSFLMAGAFLLGTALAEPVTQPSS